MNDQPFFALSSYHVGMALVGAGIIAAFWLREPAASTLLILFGIAIDLILPDVAKGLAPPRRAEVLGAGQRAGRDHRLVRDRRTRRIVRHLCTAPDKHNEYVSPFALP